MLFNFEGAALRSGKASVKRSLTAKTLIGISGDYSGEATPVPISNTEVKLPSAEDTWWEAAWEIRTSPVFF